MPPGIIRDRLLKDFVKGRLLRSRPHKAHGAEKDIDQLRQLVKTVASQPDAHTRSPGIVSCRPCGRLLRSVRHAAELKHGKGLSVEPNTLLPIEDRAGARAADGRGNAQQQRAEHDKSQRGSSHIEQALEGISYSSMS